MKQFITGINWTIWRNPNGSNELTHSFYQVTNKDGRTSNMFKINDGIDIIKLFTLSKTKIDLYAKNIFENNLK